MHNQSDWENNYLVSKETIRVVQPLVVNRVIDYFDEKIDKQTAYIYATILCLNVFIGYLLVNPGYFQYQRYGMQIRISLCGLMYKKVTDKTDN
jgi:hypothetical protein